MFIYNFNTYFIFHQFYLHRKKDRQIKRSDYTVRPFNLCCYAYHRKYFHNNWYNYGKEYGTNHNEPCSKW